MQVRPVELDEIGTRGTGCDEERNGEDDQEPGCHLNGEYSALLGSRG